MHGILSMISTVPQLDMGSETECFQDGFDSLTFDDIRSHLPLPDSGCWEDGGGHDNLAGLNLAAGRFRAAQERIDGSRTSASPIAVTERDSGEPVDTTCEQDPFDSLLVEEDSAHAVLDISGQLAATVHHHHPPLTSHFPAAIGSRRRSLETPASTEDFAAALAAHIHASCGRKPGRRRRHRRSSLPSKLDPAAAPHRAPPLRLQPRPRPRRDAGSGPESGGESDYDEQRAGGGGGGGGSGGDPLDLAGLLARCEGDTVLAVAVIGSFFAQVRRAARGRVRAARGSADFIGVTDFITDFGGHCLLQRSLLTPIIRCGHCRPVAAKLP
jgi:hypothetical protein